MRVEDVRVLLRACWMSQVAGCGIGFGREPSSTAVRPENGVGRHGILREQARSDEIHGAAPHAPSSQWSPENPSGGPCHRFGADEPFSAGVVHLFRWNRNRPCSHVRVTESGS